MFVVTYSKTMAGAKQIVPDEPIKRVTPRLDRLNEISRKWQARQQGKKREADKPAPVRPANRIPRTPAQNIIFEVCRRHGVSLADVLSNDRHRPIVKARTEAIWALKEWRPELSLLQIGRLIGGRDHTTVLHALRKRGQ